MDLILTKNPDGDGYVITFGDKSKVLNTIYQLPTLAGYFGLDPKISVTWPEETYDQQIRDYLDTKVGTSIDADPGYFSNRNAKT